MAGGKPRYAYDLHVSAAKIQFARIHCQERLNFYPGFGIWGFERAMDNMLLQLIFQA
jgi:hypothetical protein